MGGILGRLTLSRGMGGDKPRPYIPPILTFPRQRGRDRHHSQWIFLRDTWSIQAVPPMRLSSFWLVSRRILMTMA